MLVNDQVICDCCGCDMGKLMSQPAPQSDLLPDLHVPPYFASCPDCACPQANVMGASNE